MNSIEFKKVLDLFDIHSITGSTKSIDGKNKSFYSWRGIDVFFGGTYYAVVYGCVPYEVARIMSKKYPDYRNDVRINGNYGYGKVGDKKYYPKDEMGNTYIDTYHIDSVEGLIYLLSEIRYFYEVRTYTEETRKALYREQRELIARVYRELLEDANPSYATDDWKRDHGVPIKGEYDEIVELVKQFDETVNPYINSEVEVKDPIDFINKVKMNIYYGRFNELHMTLETDGGEARCFRGTESRDKSEFLQYVLFYKLRPDYIMDVDHTVCDEYDEIRLYGFKSDHSSDEGIDLRYDMNTGMVHSSYRNNYHPITEEERELFISELNKALKAGQKLILNRMTKKKINMAKKLR